MNNIKVCRICLVMDVKMYDLQSYPLGTYFEPITGINPLSMTDLPPYACYECASLVKKYYFFRERCLRGQAALYGIVNSSGKVTKQDVRQIDREYFHLTSNLSFSDNEKQKEFHFSDNEVKHSYVKDEPNIQTEFLIHPENDNDIAVKVSLDDYDQDDDFKDDDFDDFKPAASVSSDDNEPLSLHKSNKEKSKRKVVKKKIKKIRKKKELVDNVQHRSNEALGLSQETTLNAVPVETSEVSVKPKRGRPRKNVQKTKVRTKGADDEIDIEEYVTIIKLTEEQQKEEINKRQQSSNYLNAPFQCNLCYKGFIDTHAWKHHVGKHDPSAGDLECPICKFRFKTRRTLQKHVTNHEKKYACKACPYVSKTTTQAKQHQRWHKGVTYKCQYCDEISTKWTSYLSHVRMKHPSQHVCGACGYSFVSALGLAMHRTMMHKDVQEKSESGGAKEEGLYCADCDVRFISMEAWKRHTVTSVKHTQSNDFKGCRVCGETFPCAEELRLHHRREHARKRPKNYGKKPSALTWPAHCEHCSEEIANARDYWTHFRRVHPDKNYPIQKDYICDICGKSFRGNAFLEYHKRTHSETRAFQCAQCPKAFFNRTNLHMHERTHSELRPHRCALCRKAFKCKGALDRHTRSHTGVKPYACEVCGKAFAQSNSRKLHVRTVHLKQPSPYLSRSRMERRDRVAAQLC